MADGDWDGTEEEGDAAGDAELKVPLGCWMLSAALLPFLDMARCCSDVMVAPAVVEGGGGGLKVFTGLARERRGSSTRSLSLFMEGDLSSATEIAAAAAAAAAAVVSGEWRWKSKDACSCGREEDVCKARTLLLAGPEAKSEWGMCPGE